MPPKSRSRSRSPSKRTPAPDEKKLTELKEDEPCGEIIVHGGNNISRDEAFSAARMESMAQVTKVVFLLNITTVGDRACMDASILVVVDIPEGITSIGKSSFNCCSSLKEIKFPKSLRSIGGASFCDCSGLEKVNLLHTNVHKLGESAFYNCTSLREMKIPDSLQTFNDDYGGVFEDCSKLVPSNIYVNNPCDSEAVVAYLLSIQ